MTALHQRLGAAAERRAPLANAGHTTAYRLVHGSADGVPDVTVDWLAGVAVLSLYRPFEQTEERELVAAVVQVLAAKAVYVKRRPREARVLANTRKADLAPEQPAAGEAVQELWATEEGLAYCLRPGQGLSVGLYLDARDARAYLRSHARGQRVLNLFAYTCGFGLSAAAGGASEVVNVDVSRRVLEWGKLNAAHNTQVPAVQQFHAADVFEDLRRKARKGMRFDWLVLDPPSFATTRESRFSAARDYPRLAAEAAAVAAPGARLLALCNLAGLTQARFLGLVEKGLASAGRPGRVLDVFGPSPLDFPPGGDDGGALKVLALQL